MMLEVSVGDYFGVYLIFLVFLFLQVTFYLFESSVLGIPLDYPYPYF